eukprot:CAMPEP_0201281754 /NCGR_PEP_ID=MMETSP1317-20130820/3972_1 /ASSEMBLY_ACC=CAM_ASM_000770 /TAXON_ID=187299 /ORGANISM="Undescribed Undescribed, Strain Undescribed" /LENGTH=44 /DNA_ID= /DNA_START= /DNA_END= /DNA_ORIENTATION=
MVPPTLLIMQSIPRALAAVAYDPTSDMFPGEVTFIIRIPPLPSA